MRKVSSSENRLLTLARLLMGEGDRERVRNLIGGEHPPLLKMGGQCALSLKEILAKGAVRRLLREGGYGESRHFEGDRVFVGRPFLKYSLALHFTEDGARLLFTILNRGFSASAGASAGKDEKREDAEELKGEGGHFTRSGDLLLLYYAADFLLREEKGGWRASSLFHSHPLLWLGYYDVLCEEGPPDPDRLRKGFLGLSSDEGAKILEMLQNDLARRWFGIQMKKGSIRSPERMIRLGEAEKIVLEAYEGALRENHREDLAQFLARSGERILGEEPEKLIRSLDSEAPLSEREKAHRSAAAFVESLELFLRWAENARQVPFFEEGYECRQWILKQWEFLDGGGYGRSRDFVSRLQGLQSLTADRDL